MQTPTMLAKRFLTKQLAHPSGFFGRFVMGRLLNAVNADHNRLVLKQLTLSAADRVLEVGFGGGALLEKISQQPPEGFVAGVELSEEMVSRARLRFRAQLATGRVDVRHGNVQSLPYPDASFDKACSVNTIYFWPDVPLALAELLRIVRPGGFLVLGFFSDDDFRRLGFDELGFVPYSPDELSAALSAGGFRPGLLQSGSDVRGTFFTLTAERSGSKAMES